MNRVLGISFGAERIYCAVVSRENGGYYLENAASFAPAGNIDPQHKLPHIQRVVRVLRQTFDEMGKPCKNVAVSFPSTWMHVNTIPAPQNSTEAQLQERVGWELRQHFPDRDTESFAALIYPLATTPRQGTAEYLCVCIEKILLQHAREMFSSLDVEFVGAEIAPFAALETLSINYPEITATTGKTLPPNALIEFAGNAVIFTSIANRSILTHHEFAGEETLVWNEALARAEEIAGTRIENIFLHGERLTQSMLDVIQDRTGRNVRRLNAFRRLTPIGLSPRAEQYCRRTAHLFIAAVGAAIKPMQAE